MRSQNGYPAPATRTRTWKLPFRSGAARHLILMDGPVGFILCHLALWFHETIEALNVGTWDEWGAAFRPVRGATVLSNHASGTAMDLNATEHPMGVRGTFKAAAAYVRIRARLVWLRRCVGWGGDYAYRCDEMHFEIRRGPDACRRLAARLATTPRGLRILRANPGALYFLELNRRQARRVTKALAA